jgi:hypothetical protein
MEFPEELAKQFVCCGSWPIEQVKVSTPVQSLTLIDIHDVSTRNLILSLIERKVVLTS